MRVLQSLSIPFIPKSFKRCMKFDPCEGTAMEFKAKYRMDIWSDA